ncbi:MAG TPA: BrnT family toxin [Myxococcales bacterium LLY-WYZ-16_1]|nr:BrnT family toxin [Myxococcales bacterium LLY-WYZ-16_1]
MRLDWDEQKNETNKRKHGLSFDDASELFTSGVDYLEVFDLEHSEDEDRFICIGPTSRGVLLVVKTEPQENVIRIISARRATQNEERLFEAYAKGGRP